jgi:hypothetical protein
MQDDHSDIGLAHERIHALSLVFSLEKIIVNEGDAMTHEQAEKCIFHVGWNDSVNLFDDIK